MPTRALPRRARLSGLHHIMTAPSPTNSVSGTHLDALASFDTLTLCNALEIVGARFRLTGDTREPLLCTHPELGSAMPPV
jgi:hypothetical protein